MLSKGFLGAENDRTEEKTWRSGEYVRFQDISQNISKQPFYSNK
jgi:hypothetical protein